MKKPVLIIGATSSIARSAAHAFAAKGHPLFLAARDEEELSRIATDIKIRYQVEAKYGYFNGEDYGEHLSFLQRVIQQMGSMEGVLLAFGDLGDQKVAQNDFADALKIINTNYTGACSILTHCANYLGMQGSGFIIGITSVAGDRGRQSNYIYGSAKGGLNIFLEGLRNRLFHAGVRVITIKPGFVDTAMTFGKPGLFLVASPQYVGEKIAKTIDKSKDVVYIPWFWGFIMWIIKSLPESIFKRLKL
jgi:decaprenylphospho-beta-D-erythro-pentofuranosid-2-ulose 2-reductase